MPNWCDNFITITFNRDKPKEVKYILELKKAIEEERLCDFLRPMPKHQPDLTKPNPFFREGALGTDETDKFGRNNWYDWSIDNWGSKWEINEGSAEIYGDRMYVNFTSAWSPPTRATTFIKLPFKHYFSETGQGFMGHLIKENRRSLPIETYADINLPANMNRKSEHEVEKALVDICLNNGLEEDLPDAMGIVSAFTDYDS